MKSLHWAILIGVILLLSCLLSLYIFFPSQHHSAAEIWSDNQLIKTVDLHLDQSFTVTTADGFNTITVKDGHIAVTDADCPDHHCISRGFCNSGAPIVCLPHRLVIQFVGETEIDAIIG